MYICLCFGVSDKKLKKLKKEGKSSLREVQRLCAAGTNCGTCLPALQEALDEEKPQSTGT